MIVVELLFLRNTDNNVFINGLGFIFNYESSSVRSWIMVSMSPELDIPNTHESFILYFYAPLDNQYNMDAHPEGSAAVEQLSTKNFDLDALETGF